MCLTLISSKGCTVGLCLGPNGGPKGGELFLVSEVPPHADVTPLVKCTLYCGDVHYVCVFGEDIGATPPPKATAAPHATQRKSAREST